MINQNERWLPKVRENAILARYNQTRKEVGVPPREAPRIPFTTGNPNVFHGVFGNPFKDTKAWPYGRMMKTYEALDVPQRQELNKQFWSGGSWQEIGKQALPPFLWGLIDKDLRRR
jgi:hypothetical protein